MAPDPATPASEAAQSQTAMSRLLQAAGVSVVSWSAYLFLSSLFSIARPNPGPNPRLEATRAERAGALPAFRPRARVAVDLGGPDCQCPA
jgi:hypothetical protein